MKLFDSKITLVAGVVFLMVAVSLIFQSTIAQQASAPAPSVDNTALLASSAPDAKGFADRTVTDMQARVRSYPDDYKAYSQLGAAYLQKARETNDPTFYTQAESAFQKALTLKPDDVDSMDGLGSLELSRHGFRKALDWGMKARALNPSKAYTYGVIGDAYNELGDYDQAVNTFQKMVDLRPDLSSYSRVSYARELHGDLPGATEAMQQAVAAGGPAAENTAWCRVQLGNLYFNTRQLDKAEEQYNNALQAYPDYLHALAGLAQVRWAQGKTSDAIDLLKRAVANVPLPQYVTQLGDLYTAQGDKAAAQQQYDLVLYIYHVLETNGVNAGIEKAAFLADRDQDIPTAVKLAEGAATDRQDVHTQDSLAWVLYKAGRYDEALKAEKSAMRLGTQNALFYFHIGMIYGKMGDQASARANLQKALGINPNFSMQYSKVAAEALKK